MTRRAALRLFVLSAAAAVVAPSVAARRRPVRPPGGTVHVDSAGDDEACGGDTAPVRTLAQAVALVSAGGNTCPVSAESGPGAAPCLRVYPNPARGRVTVGGTMGDVEVVDLLGRVVLVSSVPTIDVSALAPGLYVVSSGTASARLSVRR